MYSLERTIRLVATASDTFPRLRTVSELKIAPRFSAIERDQTDVNRMALVSISCTKGAAMVQAPDSALANSPEELEWAQR